MRPLLVALAFLTACGPRESRTSVLKEESVYIERDKAEMVNVELRLAAGELRVSGGASKLLEAHFKYDEGSAKPKVRYDTSAFRGRLVVEQERAAVSGGESHWDLKLANDIPMDVKIHSGATEAHLALGSLDIRSLECNVGVGSVELDLRGTPKRSYAAEVNGGVGEAVVRLPAGVNIHAEARGAIGDINVQGLAKEDGRWVRRVDRIGAPTIRLEVQGGVGSIQLIAE